MDEDLRYPLGTPSLRSPLTPSEREEKIRVLAELPGRLRDAVSGLTDTQLDTPYRPGGWTVRQVVHHLPDSHLNAYLRFKKAVTEDHPTVQPYDEKAWAEQGEARSGELEMSLRLVDGLHRRWVTGLEALPDEAWSRGMHHPEVGELDLDQLLCLYDWHCRHHLAHILGLRDREGW
ncbi:MAG: putative metal-dependent hydrolase [Gemmatimonadales bacterium]|jgi:hypothetical protein|nr:MAG: putative metal-dependent hydrolase [Gemmatimonadales bacterium]